MISLSLGNAERRSFDSTKARTARYSGACSVAKYTKALILEVDDNRNLRINAPGLAIPDSRRKLPLIHRRADPLI